MPSCRAETANLTVDRVRPPVHPHTQRERLRRHRQLEFGKLKSRMLSGQAASNTAASCCKKLLEAFDRYVVRVQRTEAPNLTPGPVMDTLVAESFEEFVRESLASREASATPAALGRCHPLMPRHGTTTMPVSRRPLVVLSRLDPGRSRMPLPPGAIAPYMRWFEDRDMFFAGVGVALAMSLCLRPKEVADLTWGQVHPPAKHVVMFHWVVLLRPDEARISSKTGRFSDCTEIDGFPGVWLKNPLRYGKALLSPSVPVLQMSPAAFSRECAKAGGERMLDAIRPKSVVRFTKDSRLAEQMVRLARGKASATSAWRTSSSTRSPPSNCSRTLRRVR